MDAHNNSTHNNSNYVALDLGKIITFSIYHLKIIGAGACLGVLLGVGVWAAFAPYKAESVLINNAAFSFVSWRGLQKNLPILASQVLDSKMLPPNEELVYKRIADSKWWTANVVPTFSLTKTDTKDLATISKDLQDSDGSNILNLVVTATGTTRESADSAVQLVVGFIKQGSSYLRIKSLINGYEALVLNTDADLQKRVLDAEVDLKFMRERVKNLEVLRQRFPQNAAVGTQQIVDLKDSSAKFMPISTQIVAINMDINNTVESLQKMHNQLAKSKVLRKFVEKAAPLVTNETNGLVLADDLLKVESEMRSMVVSEDANSLQALNEIRASLVALRTLHIKGLDTNLVPQVTKPGPLVPAACGFFGGALTALLYALWRNGLNGLWSRKASVST